MTPDQLLPTLMIALSLLGMLFVAFGVRGPSRWDTVLWRFEGRAETIAREMGEMLLPAFPDMIDSIIDVMDEFADFDAAIEDGVRSEG